MPSTFFRGKIPLPLIQEEPSCQLLAKEWALNTGILPLGGFQRNVVVKVTDLPDMTSCLLLIT